MRKRPRILLVEDDEVDIKLIEKAIRRLTWDVELSTVNNGEEALAFLRQIKPFGNAPDVDLIIVDINMPRMNGKEFLVALREDQNLEGRVVLVLSSSANENDVDDCYRMGANGYIIKPETPQAIQASLNSLCEFWFSVAHLPTQ